MIVVAGKANEPQLGFREQRHIVDCCEHLSQAISRHVASPCALNNDGGLFPAAKRHHDAAAGLYRYRVAVTGSIVTRWRQIVE